MRVSKVSLSPGGAGAAGAVKANLLFMPRILEVLRHLQRRRCLTSGRWTVIYDGRDGSSIRECSTPFHSAAVTSSPGRVEICGSGAAGL